MTTLVGLDLDGRPVLVVGGGPVAARRVSSLLQDGARVTVVAPQLCEDLVDRVLAQEVEWQTRSVQESDLDAVWFVHAATDDAEVNAEVCRWATERRVWSICASDTGLGSARTPATTRHAGLTVGVTSVGDPDPGRVAAVRDQLADTLVAGTLDLRHRRVRRAAGGTGRVTLVGGGPGALDLMTVRARRAVLEADVVVTDRLGPTGILDTLPADVEVIDVGKAPGRHAATQHEINAILIDQAQRGRIVARLKGGDPFLFGRGGEEHQALAAHGIPVQVVPGVTSALAAPLAAGIPVTHRGTVASVHVTHGHRELDQSAVDVVVRGHATLVVLMGIGHLASHVDQLVTAGADPEVPVAIIENASLPTQRVTRAPLRLVVAEADRRGVRAPAVVVVGAVADPDLLEPTPLDASSSDRPPGPGNAS
jgi:uroporphyrin-III C-methyltransferase/precorrin-2 dehydrogenase/sirohydrochlorin ferrochelatase